VTALLAGNATPSRSERSHTSGNTLSAHRIRPCSWCAAARKPDTLQASAASCELSVTSPVATLQVAQHVQSRLLAAGVITDSDSLYSKGKADIHFMHHGRPCAGADANQDKNAQPSACGRSPMHSRRLGGVQHRKHAALRGEARRC
jgi:hypothetical protein